MPYCGHFFGWGGGIGGMFMMFFMLIFWVVVIYLGFHLFKRVTQLPGGGAPHDTPLEIARRRYAKGEISLEEFEQMKRNLQS